MAKRTVLFVVVALALVMAIAVVLNRSSSPDGAASSDGAASARDGESERAGPGHTYAYLKVDFGQDWTETTSELVAMNGSKPIGRAAFGWLGTDPAFTTDGRYVFTLAGDQVLAISASTGKVTRVPCDGCQDRSLKCQCQTVAPIGASQVAWLGRGNRLTLANLADRAPSPRRTATTVPTWRNDVGERANPHLLAGTDGAVLAAYPDSLSSGTGPVYLVPLDGAPRRLAPGRQDAVESAAFSPDGTRLALAGDQAAACATVTVVSLTTGRGKTSPVMAAANAKCATRDGYVGAVWWDPDGALNVTFQPADEEGQEGQAATRSDVQRRLVGDRWVAADVDPARQAHRLVADATATLSQPGVRGQGRLTYEAGGQRTRIQDGVNRVAVSPR